MLPHVLATILHKSYGVLIKSRAVYMHMYNFEAALSRSIEYDQHNCYVHYVLLDQFRLMHDQKDNFFCNNTNQILSC